VTVTVARLDLVDPEPRPAVGQRCRGCEVVLRASETDDFCASCLAVVAVSCGCGVAFNLPRVPDLWPVCTECGHRSYVATTARASFSVSP